MGRVEAVKWSMVVPRIGIGEIISYHNGGVFQSPDNVESALFIVLSRARALAISMDKAGANRRALPAVS